MAVELLPGMTLTMRHGPDCPPDCVSPACLDLRCDHPALARMSRTDGRPRPARPIEFTPQQIQEIRQAHAAGTTPRQLSRTWRTTVSAIIDVIEGRDDYRP